MELLVVIAVILVLAAIALPVYNTVQSRAHKQVALNNMRQLGAAAVTYAAQNDNQLPNEDVIGPNTWAAASLPENATVWYNALPAILGVKGVAQYADNPQGFYTKENILYLPGAKYPSSDKKLVEPLFAIAINTKLQRKDATGIKVGVRLNQIPEPARTVLFFENGLKGETRAMKQQPKYDGNPKGSAKSFVARYSGYGVLTFVDGHSETVEGANILAANGDLKFPLEPGDIIWGRSRDEDPNAHLFKP